jgi:hypothetical protein
MKTTRNTQSTKTTMRRQLKGEEHAAWKKTWSEKHLADYIELLREEREEQALIEE